MRWPPEPEAPDVAGLVRTAEHVVHVRSDAADDGDEVAGEALELAEGLLALHRSARIVDGAGPARAHADGAVPAAPTSPWRSPLTATLGEWPSGSAAARPSSWTSAGTGAAPPVRRWGERLPTWLPEVLIAALHALAEALGRGRAPR